MTGPVDSVFRPKQVGRYLHRRRGGGKRRGGVRSWWYERLDKTELSSTEPPQSFMTTIWKLLAQSSETKVRIRRVVPIEDTPTSGWAKGVLTSDKINRSMEDIPTSAWSNVIGRLVISAHRRVISAHVYISLLQTILIEVEEALRPHCGRRWVLTLTSNKNNWSMIEDIPTSAWSAGHLSASTCDFGPFYLRCDGSH